MAQLADAGEFGGVPRAHRARSVTLDNLMGTRLGDAESDWRVEGLKMAFQVDNGTLAFSGTSDEFFAGTPISLCPAATDPYVRAALLIVLVTLVLATATFAIFRPARQA